MEIYKKLLINYQILIFFTAFSACLITLPFMISDDKDADFEALMEKDERSMGFRRRIFKNPRFKDIAKSFLPIFDRKGLFDQIK